MSTAWMARRNCADVDPDGFFPDKGRSVTKEAKAACAACPVAAECLQYALDTDQLGYWGGVTETKRQHMPGGRRSAKPATNRDDNLCRNGHPRTDQNTLIRKNGQRLCRVCQRESRRRSSERASANAA